MVKDGERIALVECAHLEPRGACLFIIAAEWERAATVGLGGGSFIFVRLFVRLSPQNRSSKLSPWNHWRPV